MNERGVRFFVIIIRVKPVVLTMILRLFRIFAAVIMALILSGCGMARHGLAALQSTSDFMVLEYDHRILYEPRAKDFAEEIAKYLPDAISTVEREQYRTFARSVEVYICDTKESFARFTGEPEIVRATVTTRHLFLSAERIKELKVVFAQTVLTHELSHLHLQQYLGAYNYGANLPAWFQEGMAEYVSGGASMEEVSDSEALKAILEGRHISPDATGSFFFPKRWTASGLKPPMFYRQSFMFVSYLSSGSKANFHTFISALEDGGRFEDAFIAAFGSTPDTVWQEFVAAIKADTDNSEAKKER
jgi:hypothetical protein